MVVNIEFLTKKIRLNGGKIAPLVADALDAVEKKIKVLEARIEGATSHEVFWEAVNECHLAGEELSAARHAMGFVTHEELEKATTYSYWDTAIYVGVAMILGFLGGVLGAAFHG